MKTWNLRVLAVAAVILIFLVGGGVYVVDEREQVILTQFGRAVGTPVDKAGLYYKIPWIQTVNRFPKTLMEWDGDPGQIPTLDKTFIWVDAFARWRVIDALRFFQTVGNEQGAQKKLDDIIDAAVRNAITSYHLIETVRNSNREKAELREVFGVGEAGNESLFIPISVGRDKITHMILENAARKLLEFGIELVDVRIKRIKYVDEVQKSVFARMIQERKQIAENIRSEGQGEANIIAGNKAKRLLEISSKAYREVQEIKGEADAEAAHIYAEAFGKDTEFYSFLKSLEVYGKALDEKSTLILDTQADLWRYLKRVKP
jgi:modulator of FtsH protease HflC